ncbi:MAG: hypothetical protein CM15mP68_2080 [Pseudomonadota bacterium]|nr:MAG: hypothetical protein CM15mP68_2080 [Pseudomonadota bacterium]
MTARNVDSRALTPGSIEGAGKLKRQTFALAQGIDKDNAREITKVLKESKLKIQSQINGDKVRVTGKKRDDLQAAMAALKESAIAMPCNTTIFVIDLSERPRKRERSFRNRFSTGGC